jgi:ABC-type cobalamin transport system permease subunit
VQDQASQWVAAAVGAALGLSGAAMQGYLRNPLADPGLFGVSAGAALGAVLSLFFGYTASAWLLPAFSLLGAVAIPTMKTPACLHPFVAGTFLEILCSGFCGDNIYKKKSPCYQRIIIYFIIDAILFIFFTFSFELTI